MQFESCDVDTSSDVGDAAAHSAQLAWWVYLLRCRDGRTYAGIAIDVAARFDVHASGKGAKFTRANRPIAILGAQSFATKSAALQAEHALKKMKPLQKLAWAQQFPYDFACYLRSRKLMQLT